VDEAEHSVTGSTTGEGSTGEMVAGQRRSLSGGDRQLGGIVVAVIGLKTRQGKAGAEAVAVLCGQLGTKVHNVGTAVVWLWTRT
jgi:hypothetical protein